MGKKLVILDERGAISGEGLSAWSEDPPAWGGQLLVSGDAAALLGISEVTLRKLAKERRIPYYVFSRRGDRRYAIADLRAFMKGRMVRAKP